MRRSGVVSLVGIVVVVLGALIWSIAAGNSVLLGLDLEGGAEVVLEPVEDTELTGDDLDDAIDRSVEIIRNRVDGLGVAEPDITRQGNRIVVQLPGVEDQQRALEVVGQTAELRFRPVCSVLPAEPIDLDPQDAGDSATDGDAGETAEDAESANDVPDQPFGITPQDADPIPVEDGGADTGADGTGADGSAAEDDDPPVVGAVGCEDINIGQLEALSLPSTEPEDDIADQPVILPELDETDTIVEVRYLLGRTMLTGASLEDADATTPDGFTWLVNPIFKSGDEGIDLFNVAAAACNSRSAACPSGQLAAVLDGVVESAPTVNEPFFQRDQITISGSFAQQGAEDLALVLRFGALPLEFGDPTDPESGSRVRLVSATLGRDSLDAGIVAGIVGLVLVAIYMIAYYRLLGVAAILSLAVSGTMLWVLLAFLSETRNLAVTLAGVVGLIVSIGTSLDSNVVYFEHLKEDIANGRTLRSSVDRSFPVAFRTIFYANLASLIGALILYTLTVGSVRGFALMLGLASVLDLIATYFFLRPAVRLMARGQTLVDRPGLYGLPATSAPEAS
jgi:preprotein translocase subunit SecD